MSFHIEEYINSLPSDILIINVSFKNLTYLPDLSRFTKLEELYCKNNELVSLPQLPNSLKRLCCENNQLSSLPELNDNLILLSCCDNELVLLPQLPNSLESLYCENNQLRSLPQLPNNLESLYCENNELRSLPPLNDNLYVLMCDNNPIYYLPYLNNNLEYLSYISTPIYNVLLHDKLYIIKKHIIILNNMRHLYYCIKFKKQFRKWLWEKIREPKILKQFHPSYLFEKLLNENENEFDLDNVLENWD